MSWERPDAWRDSYDSWKLATPPEYEGEDENACPDCGGRGEVWLSPCYYPCQTCGGSGHYDEDGTEPCPNCNVEWADQHLGDCDICHGERRVRTRGQDEWTAAEEAAVQRQQALIAAILGPEEVAKLEAEDDEIEF